MPLDPVIPVSTLRVWRGSHRDRARGRDDTPRGMRRRMRVANAFAFAAAFALSRRSPCQGVRLDIVRCAAIPVRERVRVRGGAFAFAAAFALTCAGAVAIAIAIAVAVAVAVVVVVAMAGGYSRGV